jgi:hypothetical protein
MPTGKKNDSGLHTYNCMGGPDLSLKNGHAKFCVPHFLADTSPRLWHRADRGDAFSVPTLHRVQACRAHAFATLCCALPLFVQAFSQVRPHLFALLLPAPSLATLHRVHACCAQPLTSLCRALPPSVQAFSQVRRTLLRFPCLPPLH